LYCFIINDATRPRTPRLHRCPHGVVLFLPSPPGAQEPRPSDLRLPLLGLHYLKPTAVLPDVRKAVNNAVSGLVH